MAILPASELRSSSKSMEVRSVWPCAFPLFPFTLAFAFGATRRWSRRAGTVAAIGGGLTWLGVAEASEEVASGSGDPPLRALRCRRVNRSWLGVGNGVRVTTGAKWWDEESFSEDSTSLIYVYEEKR
ncbi:hypothetical protein JB92DRAFT_2852511 [Gautieria morchelliformis]|nr:hypothetical protein JB92DRAFT_2852511 [Gautieria morchelliformis]